MFERRSTANRRVHQAVSRVVMAFALSESAAARRQGGDIPSARVDYDAALYHADGDPIITSLIKTRAANTVREVAGDSEALLDESYGLLGEAKAHLGMAGDGVIREVAKIALDFHKYNTKSKVYDLRSRQEATTIDMHGIDTDHRVVSLLNGYPLNVSSNGHASLHSVEELGGNDGNSSTSNLPQPSEEYGWSDDEIKQGWSGPEEETIHGSDQGLRAVG